MTNGKWIRFLAAHVPAVFGCVQLLCAADPSVRPVALAGNGPAGIAYGPNLGANVVFSAFNLPTINAQGQLVFKATFQGPSSGTGIWTSPGSGLNLIARTGLAGPGPNVGQNVTFSAINDPLIDDTGNIVFDAVLTGSGISATNNTGIWSNAGGALAPVFRIGASGPGPDVSAGITFSNVTYPSFDTFHIGANGRVLTLAQIAGSGIDATNNTGYWLAQNGARTNIARTGTGHNAGPDLGAGVSYSILNLPAAINSAGDMTVFATLSGSGVSSANNQAFIKISGGNHQVIARTGPDGPGPNLGPGVFFNLLQFDEHAGPSSSNELVFSAFLSGPGIDPVNPTGIWASKNGALRTVARQGTDGQFGPGLGPGVYFGSLVYEATRPIINDAGDAAFKAGLTGNGITSANNLGIWAESNSILALIARAGDADPTGVSTFSFFSDPSMNALGQVAFIANLKNGNKGLYFWHDHLLTEIARTGTLFDINPDPAVQDMRSISDIEFAGHTSTFFSQISQSGGDDGRGTGLSDDGTLAFRLRIGSSSPADNLVSDGIFTAHPVPEPSSIVLILGGFGFVATRVRRGAFLRGQHRHTQVVEA